MECRSTKPFQSLHLKAAGRNISGSDQEATNLCHIGPAATVASAQVKPETCMLAAGGRRLPVGVNLS